MTLCSETLCSEMLSVAGVELTLLRPESPEALIDEEAFAHDEFLPYWAELWPAATALAEALPDVGGCGVVELGCGLGVPSLVAAARGADGDGNRLVCGCDRVAARERGAKRSRPRAPRSATGASRGRTASTSCSRPTSSTSTGTSNRCSRVCASSPHGLWSALAGRPYEADVPAPGGRRRAGGRARRSAHASELSTSASSTGCVMNGE